MATINFNGSVDARGSIFGDNGTINNYNQVINDIEQIRDALSKIDDDGARALAEEATVLLEEKSDSKTLGTRLSAYKDKAIGWTKDIAVLEKFKDSETVKEVMGIIEKIFS